MDILRFVSHYGMHFIIPGAIAFIFFKNEWKKVWLIFILTMLVDLDHLLANPIFAENRCSINFHPLHSYYAIIGYIILVRFPKTRIIAIGLLFHMFTDWIDCFWI